MAERRPPGVRFETWIDRQIRQAAERGEFDNLPGAGKPLSNLGRPHDETWWVKDKLRRENLSYLPPTLALRKEVHDTLQAALGAGSEAEAREIVRGLNETIAEANRSPLRGPPVMIRPVNAERLLEDWRRRRGRR
jgi:DnaJ-like protein